jgi:methylenetetrahydrofolate dehydrogenase (NADP+)/methenyltetrahydrofolate cyclohydrolase
MLIDGKNIAAQILGVLAGYPVPRRGISAILLGDNPSSKSFLRQKEKTAAALGIPFFVHELPITSTTDEVIELIYKLKEDAIVGGIIVQLPLPQHIFRSAIFAAIPPEKDVDVLTPSNILKFENGSKLMPPAAGAIEAIIKSLHIRLQDKCAAVVGYGTLVGKPAVIYLKNQVKSLEIIEKRSFLPHIRRADLIVSGTGEQNLITADLVRPGTIVIDFGYPHDTDFEAIDKKGGIVTPTPGGTGPIVVAKLFENLYRLEGLLPSN